MGARPLWLSAPRHRVDVAEEPPSTPGEFTPNGRIVETGKRDPPGALIVRKTRLPWVYGSVIEVEFVLLGNRIPVLVPFLEDGVEEGADDLPELLNLRPEARQLLHHFLVGRGHSQPLTAAITG